MVLHSHFTFKPFSGHAQKRERGRKKEERVEIVQSQAPRYRPKPSSPRLSKASIAKIARRDHQHRVDRDRDHVKLRSRSCKTSITVARKCEQQVKNVFSMVFSKTQLNISKYFSKHFLKCNQTHENIFLSEK